LKKNKGPGYKTSKYGKHCGRFKMQLTEQHNFALLTKNNFSFQERTTLTVAMKQVHNSNLQKKEYVQIC